MLKSRDNGDDGDNGDRGLVAGLGCRLSFVACRVRLSCHSSLVLRSRERGASLQLVKPRGGSRPAFQLSLGWQGRKLEADSYAKHSSLFASIRAFQMLYFLHEFESRTHVGLLSLSPLSVFSTGMNEDNVGGMCKCGIVKITKEAIEKPLFAFATGRFGVLEIGRKPPSLQAAKAIHVGLPLEWFCNWLNSQSQCEKVFPQFHDSSIPIFPPVTHRGIHGE